MSNPERWLASVASFRWTPAPNATPPVFTSGVAFVQMSNLGKFSLHVCLSRYLYAHNTKTAGTNYLKFRTSKRLNWEHTKWVDSTRICWWSIGWRGVQSSLESSCLATEPGAAGDVTKMRGSLAEWLPFQPLNISSAVARRQKYFNCLNVVLHSALG
ncbi:hypothetical protein EVAR_63995_1 [Eumeta japonica]|uniref:Uncharacterized protein n=1 Tax=Eumeta variegata TaxID=151549 RepID=A0A4C1YZC4_EUMVA|nr:hypothetical protein EVAR_63995_1 [Eumeta japonica]